MEVTSELVAELDAELEVQVEIRQPEELEAEKLKVFNSLRSSVVLLVAICY